MEGWHYGETDLGFFIALDRDGTNIRFIRYEDWQSSSYSQEKARFRPSDFEETIKTYQSLRDGLWGPMSHALDAIDLNHLRRVGSKIRKVLYELEDGDRLFPTTRRRDGEAPLHLILDARTNHDELLEEVLRSGIHDILIENQSQIRRIISEQTIPSIDGYYAGRDEIRRMIELASEQDNLSDTHLGKRFLDQLSPQVLSDPEESNPELDARPMARNKRNARKLRSAAAWMKVTVGGGLAVANLTLGAVAGVVSALPTLGLGTVAAVVGIATSTYTGLNAASDALKDMASNLEKS